MKNQTQVCKLSYSVLIDVDERSNRQDDTKFAKVLTFSSKSSTNTLTGTISTKQLLVIGSDNHGTLCTHIYVCLLVLIINPFYTSTTVHTLLTYAHSLTGYEPGYALKLLTTYTHTVSQRLALSSFKHPPLNAYPSDFSYLRRIRTPRSSTSFFFFIIIKALTHHWIESFYSLFYTPTLSAIQVELSYIRPFFLLLLSICASRFQDHVWEQRSWRQTVYKDD